MELRHNNFGQDTDEEHLERAKRLQKGIVEHGEELCFDENTIRRIAAYPDEFEAAMETRPLRKLNEMRDMAICSTDEMTRSQYVACQEHLKGQTTSTESPEDTDYLLQRFDMDARLPDERGDFVQMARQMVEGSRSIATERPDIDLAFELFEDLQQGLIQLEDILEDIPQEKLETAEDPDYTKDYVRGRFGEPIYQWVYNRAVAHWGEDDSRLAELGFVVTKSE